MIVLLRVLALLGSLAHAVDRLVQGMLGFLPFRIPGALLLAVLLAAGAWSSAQDTTRAIAARPRPAETSVGTLLDVSTSAWVAVSGLLSGPHLDNSIYASDRDTHFMRISDDPHDHVLEGDGEPLLPPGRRETIFQLTEGDGVTRWFYVLRDTIEEDRAIVMRSARSGNEVRTRSVVAVADGLVDGRPRFVELDDAGSQPATGSLDGAADGERRTVRAAFTEATEVPCPAGDECPGGSTWRYLAIDAADPDVIAWIDSPHPPDALPVTIAGVVATDPTRMDVVLATDEMTAALDGLRHPQDLVLADGISPVMTEATYLSAFLMAILTGVLLLSASIRYPVFRVVRWHPPDLPRPVVEELIGVEVNGVLPGVSGPERLSRAPGRFGWLPARELARRAWHLRSDVPDTDDDRPRLALLAVEGSFVLPIEPVRTRLRVEPGLVATSSAVRNGLRVAGPGIRVMLGFDSSQDRDRAYRELESETDAPAVGPVPAAPPPRRPASRAWARPATVVALVAAGAFVLVAGALGVVTGEASGVETGAAVFAAVALGVLALGVSRRHPFADELLPSAAMLGIVVAVVVTLASTGCGTWLTPNIAGCTGFTPVKLVPPLVSVAAFCLSLWAIPHLDSRRPT